MKTALVLSAAAQVVTPAAPEVAIVDETTTEFTPYHGASAPTPYQLNDNTFLIYEGQNQPMAGQEGPHSFWHIGQRITKNLNPEQNSLYHNYRFTYMGELTNRNERGIIIDAENIDTNLHWGFKVTGELADLFTQNPVNQDYKSLLMYAFEHHGFVQVVTDFLNHHFLFEENVTFDAIFKTNTLNNPDLNLDMPLTTIFTDSHSTENHPSSREGQLNGQITLEQLQVMDTTLFANLNAHLMSDIMHEHLQIDTHASFDITNYNADIVGFFFGPIYHSDFGSFRNLTYLYDGQFNNEPVSSVGQISSSNVDFTYDYGYHPYFGNDFIVPESMRVTVPSFNFSGMPIPANNDSKYGVDHLLGYVPLENQLNLNAQDADVNSNFNLHFSLTAEQQAHAPSTFTALQVDGMNAFFDTHASADLIYVEHVL